MIEAPPSTIDVKEFRDPFVWKEGTEYRMIIGSGIADVGGTALLYRSRDLISWTYIKTLLVGDKTDSGMFWEMSAYASILVPPNPYEADRTAAGFQLSSALIKF